MESENKEIFEYIIESGTSRIYKHLSENDCAIVSPYRSEYTEAENKSRMMKLKSEVRKLGYGFIQFISRWVEADSETGETFSSDEQSLLIPNIPADIAMKLGRDFEQSFIIIKNEDGCREVCTTAFSSWDNPDVKFNPGDVVRTFNVSGDHILNVEEAEAIFSRRIGGPASKPIKGGKAFRLKEVFECEDSRASYFQDRLTGIRIF